MLIFCTKCPVGTVREVGGFDDILRGGRGGTKSLVLGAGRTESKCEWWTVISAVGNFERSRNTSQFGCHTESSIVVSKFVFLEKPLFSRIIKMCLLPNTNDVSADAEDRPSCFLYLWGG